MCVYFTRNFYFCIVIACTVMYPHTHTFVLFSALFFQMCFYCIFSIETHFYEIVFYSSAVLFSLFSSPFVCCKNSFFLLLFCCAFIFAFEYIFFPLLFKLRTKNSLAHTHQKLNDLPAKNNG